jgi:hypothetical protein
MGCVWLDLCVTFELKSLKKAPIVRFTALVWHFTSRKKSVLMEWKTLNKINQGFIHIILFFNFSIVI